MTDSDNDGNDLETLTERAWRQFREVLAGRLDTLPDGGTVVVSVDAGVGTDAMAPGVPPYVRVARDGSAFVVRAPGDGVLRGGFRLGEPALRQLGDLGLTEPSGEVEYWLRLPSHHVDEAAHLVVMLFRLVYDVIHPAFLTSADMALPSAPAGPCLDTPETPPSQVPEQPTDAELPAVAPRDHAHLDRLIEQALVPMLGGVPDRDDDGDIPIRCGSGVLFVRSEPDQPLVRLFADMVYQVTDRDAALHEVDVLNREIRGIQFFRCGDRVIATADLFVMPFAAEHLRWLIAHMCEVLATHDADLARRVGGRVFLDEDQPSDGITAGRTPSAAALIGRSSADAAAGHVQHPPVGAHDRDRDEAQLHDGQEAIHPVMLAMLQLEAESPGTIRPKTAAELCGYDSDLLLELISWNEGQEIAWRIARDDARQSGDQAEAQVCEHERAAVHHTLKVLRKALRRVLLG